jgi:hypothetical protein
MVNAPARVNHAGFHIVRFEIGQLFEDFFSGQTGSEQVQYIAHANPHPANTRTPAALLGIDGNALQNVHGNNMTPMCWNSTEICAARASDRVIFKWGAVTNTTANFAAGFIIQNACAKVAKPAKLLCSLSCC